MHAYSLFVVCGNTKNSTPSPTIPCEPKVQFDMTATVPNSSSDIPGGLLQARSDDDPGQDEAVAYERSPQTNSSSDINVPGGSLQTTERSPQVFLPYHRKDNDINLEGSNVVHSELASARMFSGKTNKNFDGKGGIWRRGMKPRNGKEEMVGGDRNGENG